DGVARLGRGDRLPAPPRPAAVRDAPTPDLGQLGELRRAPAAPGAGAAHRVGADRALWPAGVPVHGHDLRRSQADALLPPHGAPALAVRLPAFRPALGA